MQVGDVDEVMLIEHEAFSAPWSANAYRHELLKNEMAHYYVVRRQHAPAAAEPGARRSSRALWRSLLPKSEGHPPAAAPPSPPVLAYGGFWIMVDEAHISTIATARPWRGRGIGELLLVAMLDHAQELGAEKATLEVRVSNLVAQNLYRKYAFQVEGRRRRYYSDNGEDALIMTTPPMYEEAFQQLLRESCRKLFERLRGDAT
jgi:ribosomal-protein-alanine N-acetyltransferase